MTATQTQIRRDTSGNLATSTPALAELGYDTTNKRIIAGDGSSLGGIPHINYLDSINNVFSHISAGGTGNAITLTLTKAPTAYTQGMELIFKATAGNTGATTVNVNSLGTKNIQKISSGALAALASGDIVSGGMYKIIYDGSQFQLINIQASGITSVSQGDLNTSTGTFSVGSLFITSIGTFYDATPVTLPGGQYGFSIETSVNTAFNGKVGWHPSSASTSYVNQVRAIWTVDNTGTGSRTAQGRQRYINSSPPFDLGDGEVAGFVFALVDAAGDIVGHYAADVPPWAYNGPTRVRCDWQCPRTGKKYRRVREHRTMEEIMDGAQAVYNFEEITMAIKNADMGIIPHPFDHKADLTPVLIDPMDERIKRLLEAQNDGEDYIAQALSSGRITIDNDCMKNRKGPIGCGIHKMKFKYKK